MGLVVIVFGVILYSNYKRPQKTCYTDPGTYIPGCIESTPSPVPFALKQQCSDDADKLLSNKIQVADKDWEAAHQYQTGHTDFILNGSAFSLELNTCVAEIDETIIQGTTTWRSYYIYDTTNAKLLAQCPISNGVCDSSSFINIYPQGLNQKPNWADWANYKTSIGL